MGWQVGILRAVRYQAFSWNWLASPVRELRGQTGFSMGPGVRSPDISPSDPILHRQAQECVLEAQRNFAVTNQFFIRPEVSA